MQAPQLIQVSVIFTAILGLSFPDGLVGAFPKIAEKFFLLVNGTARK
jgi:hypothetical protein